MVKMPSPSLAVLCPLALTGMCFHHRSGTSIHLAEHGRSTVTSTRIRTPICDREAVDFERSPEAKKRPLQKQGPLNYFEPNHGNRAVRLQDLVGRGIKNSGSKKARVRHSELLCLVAELFGSCPKTFLQGQSPYSPPLYARSQV